MHDRKQPDSAAPTTPLHAWLCTLACSLLLFTSPCLAGITINHVNGVLQQPPYQINADISYELNSKVLEALENGVPLTFRLDMKIQRPRDYLWDETLASASYHFQLQYHALSRQYIVRDTETQQQRSYPSMRAALVGLGRVKGLALPLQVLPADAKQCRLHLRVLLEIGALPAPMRPQAWLSSDWHLESGWRQWPLQP